MRSLCLKMTKVDEIFLVFLSICISKKLKKLFYILIDKFRIRFSCKGWQVYLLQIINSGRCFIWNFFDRNIFINGNRSRSFCTKSCTLLNHTFKMEVSIHVKGFVKVGYQIVPKFSEKVNWSKVDAHCATQHWICFWDIQFTISKHRC